MSSRYNRHGELFREIVSEDYGGGQKERESLGEVYFSRRHLRSDEIAILSATQQAEIASYEIRMSPHGIVVEAGMWIEEDTGDVYNFAGVNDDDLRELVISATRTPAKGEYTMAGFPYVEKT